MPKRKVLVTITGEYEIDTDSDGYDQIYGPGRSVEDAVEIDQEYASKANPEEVLGWFDYDTLQVELELLEEKST